MPIFTESREVVMISEEKKVKNRYTRTKKNNVPVEFRDFFLKFGKECVAITNSMVDPKFINQAAQSSSFNTLKNRDPYNRYSVSVAVYHDDIDKGTDRVIKVLKKYFPHAKENKHGKYFYTFSKDKTLIYVASLSYRDKPGTHGTAAGNARDFARGMAYGFFLGPIGLRLASNIDNFNEIRIVVDCINDTEKNRSIIENSMFELGNEIITEEKYTPENIFGREEVKISHGDYYANRSVAMKAFDEHLDMSNGSIRREIMAMNEAEHNKVLTKLTSNLYDHIIKKTSDIDFGEIPDTKGDISKMSNYEDLKDVIAILFDIVKEYKQPTIPVDVLTKALANIETRRELFSKGFRYDCELPCMMYNNLVLSLYTGVSYLIAGCIEFIKSPSEDTFEIALDKVAYAKTKEHILYDSLEKFNKSCESGDFDKAMGVVIEKKLKKFTGAAAGIIAGTVIGITIILNIVPILRELVYCHFYTRVRISDFFETQADLLQMNAYNVEHNNTMDPETKREIADKQMKIANHFRYISNKVAIEAKRSDVETNRELQNTRKKLSLDDLEEEIEISSSNSQSALF